MSENFLGPRPVRSVAAFLWMPQLRLSFQHMSYLAPVFVRTLAGVFVAAGLLPRNHPALMYGVQGVRKYGVAELIGEAWHNLRTSRAGLNQWGIFAGVMLMFAMIAGSLITFLMTVAFGVGATAQAQLFSHPAGSSDIDRYPGGYTPQGYFDVDVPTGAGPQSDYGLMMLDKVIRAGANDVGVPLQNATQALMQIYNSGVLVVASVMLFWVILTVVVDTAKTGQIGGGRHNMVWAPIRIVFALALLIPLGSAGYSSGQFMVMKVAEWGSNFGTNAWLAYANAVVGSENLVAKSSTFSSAQTVVNFEKMWVCRMAYNSNITVGGNTMPSMLVTATTSHKGEVSRVSFGNSASPDICGSISYERFDAVDALDRNKTIIGAFTRGGIDDMYINISTFKQNMRMHFYTELEKLSTDARNLACDFVGSTPEYAGQPVPACGAAQGSGVRPDPARLTALTTRYDAAVKARFEAEMRALTRYAGGPGFMAKIREHGWAGMGAWYHRISQLNAAVAAVQRTTITITAPGILSSPDTSDATELTRRMLGEFDQWWVTNAAGSSADIISPTTGETVNPTGGVTASSSCGLGMIRGLATQEPSKAIDTVVDCMGITTHGWLIQGLHASSTLGQSSDTYPMAMLSQMGNTIFITGVALYGTPVVLQVIASLIPTLTLSENQIFDLLAKMGTTLMVAGLMLKFYIPIIPFVRTSLSVLTWIISVFEAVALVPIAALAHITTEGDGISGGAGHVWKLWLNVLLRPVMTVIGFVGALLVYNGFIGFFHANFFDAATVGMPSAGILGIFTGIALAIIYVFITYTVANTVFKMLDLIPNAMMRWIGGSADTSFDDDRANTILYAASNMISGVRAPKMNAKQGGGAQQGGPGAKEADNKGGDDKTKK